MCLLFISVTHVLHARRSLLTKEEGGHISINTSQSDVAEAT